MSFVSELKRRNVFKVAIMYLVVAWLLIQLASTLAPALLLPEWTTRLVTILLFIGFLVASLFAWAFELTPEGLAKTKDVDPAQSLITVTGQKINYMIIGVLVLGIGYLLYDRGQGPDQIDESADP